VSIQKAIGIRRFIPYPASHICQERSLYG
jgi:hypothetical protein